MGWRDILVLAPTLLAVGDSWGVGDDLMVDSTYNAAVAVSEAQMRIVGGETVLEPVSWMVSLGKIIEGEGPKPFHFCGAALIAPNYVLTAAHCLLSKGISEPTFNDTCLQSLYQCDFVHGTLA